MTCGSLSVIALRLEPDGVRFDRFRSAAERNVRLPLCTPLQKGET